MTRIAGSIADAFWASSIPSISGMTMSVSKRSNCSVSLKASPRSRTRPPQPHTDALQRTLQIFAHRRIVFSQQDPAIALNLCAHRLTFSIRQTPTDALTLISLSRLRRLCDPARRLSLNPLVHRQRCELPVLLSVPHSGRDYPGWLVAKSAHGRGSLVSLEDPRSTGWCGRRLSAASQRLLPAPRRAAVDCNRAEDDVDPSVVEGTRPRRVSARARGGLGIVPGRTHHHGSLWRQHNPFGGFEQRLVQAHRPYHCAIERQLATFSNDLAARC